MTSLWLIDRQALPERSPRRRRIGSTPLIDLAGLQQAIRDGQLKDVWVGTKPTENKLKDLGWTFDDLLDCVACLTPQDFKNAEWCEDSYGGWHPCDAYAIRYDDVAKRRVRYSDINYYLKFSLDEAGGLTLVLIRCHL